MTVQALLYEASSDIVIIYQDSSTGSLGDMRPAAPSVFVKLVHQTMAGS